MDSSDDKRDRVLKAALECRTELVAYARSLLGNYAAADDVLQEAMLVVVNKYDQFQEGTSMLAWLESSAGTLVASNRFPSQTRMVSSKSFIESATLHSIRAFVIGKRNSQPGPTDWFSMAFGRSPIRAVRVA